MGLPEDIQTALQRVYSANITEEELEALDILRNVLLPEGETHNCTTHAEEDIEKQWLSFAQLQDPADDENPFPGCQLESLILTQTGLDHFLYYLFERRFGWSECRNELKKAKRGLRAETEAKNKIHINDHLDGFIKWFQWHSISLQLLSSLTYCIKQAAAKPVVRNQTVVHSMDWLQSHAACMAEAHYQPVKTLVLLGLTDVWSAIRNTCVARLSQVLEFFSVTQLQDFFSELVQICQSTNSTWQAKEGAVMGVNSIVRHFQWVSQVSIEEVDEDRVQEEDTGNLQQQPQYFLRFGSHEFRGMPTFIVSQMQQVIFPLLAHPQLSIREHSIKAFSSFLGRCEFKGALSSFKEVVCRLCRGTGVPEDLDNYSVLPHLAMLSPEYKFLDAYEAEGLLGVCIFLVKHIPPGHLLPYWPLYFSTFSLYLSHPASTVRQATSSIFKFLVARDSHSPVILKLVLQGLCNSWDVHTAQLAAPLKSAGTGRILTDVEACTNTEMCQAGEERISITEISNNTGEYEMSDTWQWREGRLLAYELILKFLIKNHCLYTFGPPHLSAPWTLGGALPTSCPRPLTPGTSADHALFMREREDQGNAQSRSFGGSSFHTALHRTSSEKRERPILPPLSSSPLNTNVALVVLPAVEEDMAPRARTNSISSSNPTGLRTPDECAGLSGHPKPYRRGRNSICTSSPSYQLPLNLRRRQAWAQNNWVSQAAMGSSDASVFRHMSSRNSSVGDGSAQRTLVRHYSFFTEMQEAAVVPTLAAIPGDNSLNRALSLLMHTLATDVQEEQKSRSLQARPVSDSKSSLRRPSLGEAMDSQCDWLKGVELQSLAIILETVLHQTVQSLGDVQWELRRMGQQLLPCVVEVIRWFDMAVLDKMWSCDLQPVTSTLTYGACLALKYSLAHAAKLQPMLHTIPISWQDPEMCRQVVLRITSCVCEGLPKWLTVVHALLRRHLLDKITTVSVELLLQAHTHFSLPADQKEPQVQAMVGVVLETFCLAHPDSELTAFIKRDVTVTRKVVTLKDGYLSCCVRSATPQQNAQQVEKYLLENVQSGLVAFLQASPIAVTSPLLPPLAAYISIYGQNDTFHKMLLDSVNVLGMLCKTCLQTESDDATLGVVRRNCERALHELTHVITLKTVEVTLIRQVLDMYSVICQYVDPKLHVHSLLKAICTRSNIGGNQEPSVRVAFLGHVQNGGPDLTLLSNDIPMSPTPPPELPSDSDEEEDNKLDVEMIQESHLLDTSGNSSNPGHHTSSADGRGVSPLPDTSDGGGSDWDSWSEDEVEDDVVSSLIGEFLRKIESQQRNLDNFTTFQTCLQELPVKDRCLIEGIMSS